MRLPLSDHSGPSCILLSKHHSGASLLSMLETSGLRACWTTSWRIDRGRLHGSKPHCSSPRPFAPLPDTDCRMCCSRQALSSVQSVRCLDGSGPLFRSPAQPGETKQQDDSICFDALCLGHFPRSLTEHVQSTHSPSRPFHSTSSFGRSNMCEWLLTFGAKKQQHAAASFRVLLQRIPAAFCNGCRHTKIATTMQAPIVVQQGWPNPSAFDQKKSTT
ncbi:hypothetical protein HDK77DRAFT_313606 [Phyllosticta capitalensis]